MTSKRGHDIYEATEKEFDTSGYRKAVCKKWLDDQQPADFYSPTVLEPKKHGHKHRLTQKFIDMNETAKSSQRHELARARRNNNNVVDDFVEPFSGYEKRLDKVLGDVAKTKHNQPLPMSRQNEKEYEKPYRSSQTHGKLYCKSQEKPYSQHHARLTDKWRPEKQTNYSDDLDFGESDFEFPLDENVDLTRHNIDEYARKQKNQFGDENGGNRTKNYKFVVEFDDDRGIRSAKKRKKHDDLDYAILEFDDENRGSRTKKNEFRDEHGDNCAKKNKLDLEFGKERGIRSAKKQKKDDDLDFEMEFDDEHCGSRARKQKEEANDDFGFDYDDYYKNEPMIQHNRRRRNDKYVPKAKRPDRNSKSVVDDFSPEPKMVKQINESSYPELFDASPMWKDEKNERSKPMDKHRSKGISNQKHGERHTVVRYEGENRKSKNNGIGLVSAMNEVAVIADLPTKSNKNIQVFKALESQTPTGPIVFQIKFNNLNVYTD